MKKLIFTGILVMATAMLLLPNLYAQQQATETQQPAGAVEQQSQQGGWYCPWMTMKAQGQGGWQCPGYGRGAGMGGWHHRGRGMMASQYAPEPGKQLTREQAGTLLQDYLKATNNPNLKLGDISNKDGFYEADILTKDGSLADKIQVNKNTGWFRSAY